MQVEIIRHRGYRAEVHHVISGDGYILELHRIPSSYPAGRPVLLQHGILGTDANWLTNPTDQALGIKFSLSIEAESMSLRPHLFNHIMIADC